jgi:hypothetical protein
MMKQKRILKKASNIGINLTVSKKKSINNLFPEKLAKANKILSKLKIPLPE